MRAAKTEPGASKDSVRRKAPGGAVQFIKSPGAACRREQPRLSFRAASFRAVGVKPTRGALVYSKRTLPSPVTLNAAFTVAAVEQAANARQRTRTA